MINYTITLVRMFVGSINFVQKTLYKFHKISYSSIMNIFLKICFFCIFFIFSNLCKSDSIPMAVWSGGLKSGNFGFDYCQKIMNNEDDENNQSRLAEVLIEEGYKRSIYFGSTDKQPFEDLESALDVENDTVINIFSSDGNKTELKDTKVEDFFSFSNSQISTVAADIISQIGISSSSNIWAFSDENGDYHNDNCEGATSNSSEVKGRILKSRDLNHSDIDCSDSAYVVCLSK